MLGQKLALGHVAVDGDKVAISLGQGPGLLTISGTLEDGNLVGRLKQGKGDFPFLLRRIPVYPAPANRLVAWRRDIDALERRFLPVDRSFSPAEKAAFLEATERLGEEVPHLSDAQVTMRMAAAVALARNAHTRPYLLRNRTALRRLPIRLWWFTDGLRVVSAAKDYAGLLGCKVENIAGMEPRHARDLAAPVFAGNSSWVDYKSVYALTSPDALFGIGVTQHPDTVEMGFSGCRAVIAPSRSWSL